MLFSACSVRSMSRCRKREFRQSSGKPSEEHCGFREGRETADWLFFLRRMIERHRQDDKEVSTSIADFERAIDHIH